MTDGLTNGAAGAEKPPPRPVPAAGGQRVTLTGADPGRPVRPAPELAPGDLLLMSPLAGPAGNHVAVYLGEGQVIEVTEGPAAIRPLAEAAADDSAIIVARHPDLTEADRAVIVRWLRTQEGRPYDPPGALPPGGADTWFAPDLVLAAYRAASLPLFDSTQPMRPDMPMPLDSVRYAGHHDPSRPARVQGRQMDFLEPPETDRDRMIPAGHYGMTYDASLLEVGDMIVVSTAGLVSEAIRRRTGEPASHIALYVGDGYVIEAVGSGVERHALGDTLRATHFAAAYRYVGLSAAQKTAIRDFAYGEWRKGTPYDFLAVGSLQRFNDTRALFCSELVFQAFMAADVVLGDYATSTPGTVITLSGIEYLGHLPAGPEARGMGRSRRRARPFQAGAIAGAVGELGFEIAKSAVTGSAGDVAYSFDRLDGVYARDHVRWDTEEQRRRLDARFHDVQIMSRQSIWDAGRITMSVPIRFSYNGDYIANVRLSQPDDDEHFAYALRLTGEITQHPNRFVTQDGVPVSRVDLIVKHVFDYEWLGESFVDDTASITEHYRIYSNGTVYCTVTVDGTWWIDTEDAQRPFRIEGGALYVDGPTAALTHAIEAQRAARAGAQSLDLNYSPDLTGGMSMNWSSQPFPVHGTGPEPVREETPALVAAYRGRTLSSPRTETAVQIAVRHGATPDQARRFFARETSVARNRRRRSATLSASAAFPEISLVEPDSWQQGVLGEIAERVFPASLNPLQVLFDFCDAHDLTIGLGVAVTGGAIEVASGGFGLVVTSGNRVGYYGSVAVGTGWVLEVNAALQLTVIFGGPSTFTGTSLTIGGNVSLSEGPAVGGHLILDTSGNTIGFVAEVGLQAGAPGLSVVEVTQMVQQTQAQFARVAPQSLGYAAALSGPMGRGLIGGLPVRKQPPPPVIQPQGWAMRRPAPGTQRRIWS